MGIRLKASGYVKLVLVDGRENSPTFGVLDELFLGNDSRFSVLVPPGVWNGFKGIAGESSILVQADEVYADERVMRKPYTELHYDWSVKHG
jgi:dTDP-4-dehydrorhamnose 3,5-epimerase